MKEEVKLPNVNILKRSVYVWTAPCIEVRWSIRSVFFNFLTFYKTFLFIYEFSQQFDAAFLAPPTFCIKIILMLFWWVKFRHFFTNPNKNMFLAVFPNQSSVGSLGFLKTLQGSTVSLLRHYQINVTNAQKSDFWF